MRKNTNLLVLIARYIIAESSSSSGELVDFAGLIVTVGVARVQGGDRGHIGSLRDEAINSKSKKITTVEAGEMRGEAGPHTISRPASSTNMPLPSMFAPHNRTLAAFER